MSDAVSIFDLADPANPVLVDNVNTGLNPFGIGTVPGVPEPATLGISFIAGSLLLRRRP